MPFQIIRNDITKVRADVIVNSANPQPVIGSGTDSAIYAAAGAEKLLARRRRIGDITPGDAAVTPAFHLHAKHIIHTVGPVWVDGDHGERETLRSCYRRSLILAAELKARSIAFPLIATGVYGFPRDEALSIALGEIQKFLLNHEMQVILVVFERSSFELSRRLVGEIEAFIDDYGVAAVREAEYAFGTFPEPKARRRTESLPATGSAELLENENRSRTESPPASGRAEEFEEVNRRRLKSYTFRKRENQSWRENTLDDLSPIPAEKTDVCPPVTFSDALDALPATGMVPKESSLESLLAHTGDTFQQRLLQLIDESGMTDAAVYKKANIDRRVFSKMRSRKDYKPKKVTAVAFAIALELDLDTMTDLLSRAEIAFSPSSKFDLIVTYFVTHRNYDIFEINATLFKYGQPILGE